MTTLRSNEGRVFLDAASTTPLDERVLDAMRSAFLLPGNAASVHGAGRAARKLLEDARDAIGALLGVPGRSLYFTSGGTESDNWALRALLHTAKPGLKPHLVVTAIEHSAILETAADLERSGLADVTRVPPDADGIVQPEAIQEAIQPGTVLVSVMLVNNEIGAIQPIAAIAEACHARGVPLHTDAVQAPGSASIRLEDLNADLMSLSAHKLHGPKGVGLLYARRGLNLQPFMHGGHQERGARGGTSNLPGAVGLAAALTFTLNEAPAALARLAPLAENFTRRLLANPGVNLNGARAPRTPRIINVTAAGADGEALLLALDLGGVDASNGSACSAGTLEASHVLLALGRSRDEARASVRFSLPWDVQAEDLTRAASVYAQALAAARLGV